MAVFCTSEYSSMWWSHVYVYDVTYSLIVKLCKCIMCAADIIMLTVAVPFYLDTYRYVNLDIITS